MLTSFLLSHIYLERHFSRAQRNCTSIIQFGTKPLNYIKNDIYTFYLVNKRCFSLDSLVLTWNTHKQSLLQS